jgi:osmoprotectant transport system permease protein
MALASGARIILATQPPQARVSFGLGFLVLLLALYGALASYALVFRSGSARAMELAFLATLGAAVVLSATGALDGLSIVREFSNRRATFLAEAVRHGVYAAGTTTAALLIALPLGYASAKSRFWERPVFFLANTAQAVPTLSLLGLLIVPLSLLGSSVPALAAIGVRGVGWAPAFIVLFLYALLPIAANAQAGFRTIEPAALDAALGMGMTRVEGFFRVELPLALPAIIAGFRTALTQNLGNAVLAGLIGGGGLGSLIFLGLAQAAPDLILLGSLPVVAAVFASDRLMAALERSALHRAGLQGVRA